MNCLVTDTHPLVWYMVKAFKKLPAKVRRVFDNAVDGRLKIWVPLVSVWELSLLEKAGRVKLALPLSKYVEENFFAEGIRLLDMSAEDVVQSHALSFCKDAFDVMIVAMTQRVNCPLITADEIITASRLCPIFWD